MLRSSFKTLMMGMAISTALSTGAYANDMFDIFIDQAGDENTATINLTNTTDSTADIVQEGSHYTATITGNGGFENTALIEQRGVNNGTESDPTLATITQINGSEGAIAKLYQTDSSYSEIHATQSDAMDSSVVLTQEGSEKSLIEVKQEGNLGANLRVTQKGGDYNMARVHDTSHMNTVASEINQTGEFLNLHGLEGESSMMEFGGREGSLAIDQVGDGHRVSAKLMGDGNIYDIDQTGTMQKIYLETSGDGQTVTITQSLDGNRVGLDNDQFVLGGSGNTLTITRDGNGNYTNGAFTSADSTYTIDQLGDYNMVNMDTSGSDHMVTITQKEGGDNNGNNVGLSTDALTVGGSGNVLTITQDGKLNSVLGSFTAASGTNTYNIDQLGNSHLVSMAAEGSNHNVSITQKGETLGSGNSIGLQGTPFRISVAGDTGNSLKTLDVLQEGQNNTLDGYMIGDNLTLKVTQQGDENTATSQLMGRDYNANINQVGNNNVGTAISMTGGSGF